MAHIFGRAVGRCWLGAHPLRGPAGLGGPHRDGAPHTPSPPQAELNALCAGLTSGGDVASELKANGIRSVEALVSIIQQQHEDFVDLREVLPGNKFTAARQELEDRLGLAIHLQNLFGEYEGGAVNVQLHSKGVLGAGALSHVLNGSHPEYRSLEDVLPGEQNARFRDALLK